MEHYLNSLFNLARWKKQIFMVVADIIITAGAVWLAYALRLGTWTPDLQDGQWLMLFAPLLAVMAFIRLGLYRALIRFVGFQTVSAVLIGISFITLILSGGATFFDLQGIPNSVYILYWMITSVLIASSRFVVRRGYQALQNRPRRPPVLIYGAGNSGAQLALTLVNSSHCKPVAFVDDNPALQHAIIHGLKIYPPKQLTQLIEKFQIEQILLAMPSTSTLRKKEILRKLEPLAIHVRSIPSLNDLISGKHTIDELREIGVEELLGRDSVDPDLHLLTRCIQHHHVMVTGAGGSIGSELCRQIIRLNPKRLVLFELCEYSLYQIEQDLQKTCKLNGFDMEVIPVLGSVQDQQRVQETLQQYQIQTLYHAAAYKHVPLVEHNPIQGVENNILGTYRTAKAAFDLEIKHFVLISTDKAVRPTNVMGATKRMAELSLQALAEHTSKTTFSMVRFGNVLGSSGSVVPLFREQIKNGGPITITHADITRYFMTIPEAAQLVIQAGAMAQGGEVFLLDMGESVKIIDLARRMLHLNGLTERTEQNPQGDIALTFTGLRDGEKLYEELLIDNNAEKTAHPQICKAHEAHIPLERLQKTIRELEQACRNRNLPVIYQCLRANVQGFEPSYLPEALKINHDAMAEIIPINTKIIAGASAN